MTKIKIISGLLLLVMFLSIAAFAGEIDVCIDPGHGGVDKGTLTYLTDYHEKDVNLDVVLVGKDPCDSAKSR